MSLWQTPPPPQVIGPTAGTLPLPHDPIPAQGQQPPRRQVAAAMMMVAVLASWPLDLEPRLQKPNDQPQKIAPLTLTYGSQPIPTAFLSSVELNLIVTSWPPDGPLPPRGAQRSWMPSLVPFVPPMPLGQITRLVASWPLDLEPVLEAPNNRQQTIAPLTLSYGSQPTPTSFLSTTARAQIVASWPADIGPLLPYAPIRSLVSSAPVVAQPTPQPPLSVLEITQIVAAWPQTWDAQTAPKSAAWNVPPPAIVAHTPPPALIWTSWEPPYVKPPQPVSIATLTLPRGDPPTPQPALARVAQTAIVASWPNDSGPLVAWPLATPSRIVPLTLPTGPALRPHGPLAIATLMQAVATWVQTWDAQRAANNASWNVPIAPFNPAWASQSNKTVGPRISPR